VIWFAAGWACGVLTVPLALALVMHLFVTRLSAELDGSER
jgi:hypothetical protein